MAVLTEDYEVEVSAGEGVRQPTRLTALIWRVSLLGIRMCSESVAIRSSLLYRFLL
jgi:hypothetical protein